MNAFKAIKSAFLNTLTGAGLGSIPYFYMMGNFIALRSMAILFTTLLIINFFNKEGK